MEAIQVYSKIILLLLFAPLSLIISTQNFAHEDSIFVPTMSIDEPTVGDELDFIFSDIRDNGGHRHSHDHGTSHDHKENHHGHNDDSNHNEDHGSRTRSSGISAEISKVIFPNFAVSIGFNYQRLRLANKVNSGFDNTEIGLKYQIYQNPLTSSALAFGVVAELGKTGHRRVGAENETSVSPVLYFGKGLNNLCEEFTYARPLVFTGLISPTFGIRSFKSSKYGIGFYHSISLTSINV